MASIQDLYRQLSNRDYLENTYGRELWVQVSGHRELNNADAGFWAAYISLSQVNDVFRNVGWDCHVGTQAPGFVMDGVKASYQRLQSGLCACENIVHYREFYGIKPDYVEFVEEFRLLNNLYHDTDSDIYYEILDNGECTEVAKIENHTCAFVKLQFLMRYASARQMALLLFFDIRTHIPGTFSHNGLSEFSEQYKKGNLFYEIWGGEHKIGDPCVYSVLMGKRVVFPKPVEECGYWPYEKERSYKNFIIGIDEYGEPRTFTSDPDKLSNYFGANPGAPHYLTPVFFKKEVLQRYLSHPDRYSVEDGYLRCQSLWGMSIDNHHKDYVSAYLGDLGRDLPEQEQNHWLQYNIATSEKLSDVAFQRDFLCMFAESNMADLQFKAGYKNFQKKWRQKFSWDLFLPLADSDEYNFKLLRIPLTESQEEFDHQVLSLVKTIIDSLNEKEIVKQLQNSSELKGGISKLERWLSEQGIPEFEPHIKFLRNLQELRSTGTGHRKGKGYEKIKQEFGLSGNNFAEVFDRILTKANTFLSFLMESFL